MSSIDNPTAALAALRQRLAETGAPSCAMAHERVRHDAAGRPLPAAGPEVGFQRPSICPRSVRATNLACSHTMARYPLAEALAGLGPEHDAALEQLRVLDRAFGALDLRRHTVEGHRAAAVIAADMPAITSMDAQIEDLLAEHRALAARVLALRDAALAGLDAVIDATPPVHFSG